MDGAKRSFLRGDPQNISVRENSSLVAHKLHYDASQQRTDKRLIGRAYLFEGVTYMQPVIPQSTRPRAQFAELCRNLHVDSYALSREDGIRLLFMVSAEKLLQVASTLKDGFEPVTDGHNGFIPTWFMQPSWSNELGRKLKERGVQVIVAGCVGERSMYEELVKHRSSSRRLRLAAAFSTRQELVDVLCRSRPGEVATVLVARYEKKAADWQSVYCDIMADIQCHVAVRGLAQSLFKGGMTTHDVLRCDVEWQSRKTSDSRSLSTGLMLQMSPCCSGVMPGGETSRLKPGKSSATS